MFVIDTTPGMSADKNFYLEEEDKASEVATEEEKEEEEGEKVKKIHQTMMKMKMSVVMKKTY